MVELVSIHSFLIKRMMAAADEIFDAVKDNIIDYQKEIERLKQENNSLKNTLRYTRNSRHAETSNNDAQGTGPDGLLQDILDPELSEINVQMEMSLNASTNTASLSEVAKEEETIQCCTHQPEFVIKNEGNISLNVQSSLAVEAMACNNQAGLSSLPEVQHGNIIDCHIESPPEEEPHSPRICKKISKKAPRKALQNQQLTCSVCGKSFGSKKCLRMHKVVHQSERPFVCESCGFCFKLKSHLTEHKRLHTGDYRYRCSKCGKGFSRSNLVRMHLKSAHSS